jgi:hypothetical protein
VIDVEKKVSMLYTVEISTEDYKRFARGIEKLIGKDRFYIMPIGRGAKNKFGNLHRYFKSDIVPIHLVQSYDDGDEYRKILGIESAYFKGINSDRHVKEALKLIRSENEDHKGLLALESSIKETGKGGIGGFVWALENAEHLGLDEKSVYLGSFLDILGVAHIRLFGEPEKYAGPLEFMHENMPRTYDRLGDNGVLRYAAEVSEPISIGPSEGHDSRTETRREVVKDLGISAGLLGLIFGGKKRR